MAAYLRISLSAAALGLVGLWSVVATDADEVLATPPSPLVDSDDDFLPDQIEWAVLTSATNPDTDGDLVADFVEVVQRGLPRQPNAPVALDHEIRVVIGAPPAGAADQTSWLHVLVRYVEGPVPIDGFSVWFETPLLPGLHVPLESVLFAAPVIETRTTAVDGTWLRVSAPLVSMGLLQLLLPCSIQCEGSFEGRFLRTGVNLFDYMGSVATVVPFGSSGYAVQTFGGVPAGVNESNKVCVLDLSEVGSGPGGIVYQVTHAECEDCNELECGSGCTGSVGWILTIPGGAATLGGN